MFPNAQSRFIALAIAIAALITIGVAQSQSQVRSFSVPSIGGDEELAKQHCDDSSDTMDACLSFIKGFLQGALLTDTAIIQSIEAQQANKSFSQRALKTRLGRNSDSPTSLAGFCLPPERTILDLAQETLDHVSHSERNSLELAQNVYQSLQTDYPCT